MASYMTPTSDHSTSGFRPRLIEFYGAEGEDFRHFRQTLDTFFSVMGITTNSRRMAILSTQLRRAAAVHFNRYLKSLATDGVSDLLSVPYTDAIDFLQQKYVTPELLQRFELAFNDITQGPEESPQIFLSRLYEAAELAEIDDEHLIQSRFRAGLLRQIKTFCVQSSSRTFDDWLMHADGWWNAHRQIEISLVDNPFVSRDPITATSVVKPAITESNQDRPVTVTPSRSRVPPSNNLKITPRAHPDNLTKDKSLNLVCTNEASEVDQLADKLRALELHQMEQMYVLNKQPECSKCNHHTTSKMESLSEAEIIRIVQRAIKDEMRVSPPNGARGNSYNHGGSNNNKYNNGTRRASFSNNVEYYDDRRPYNKPAYDRHDDARDRRPVYGGNNYGYNRQRNAPPRDDETTHPDYFDNDPACPTEGYYPNRRYGNNNGYNNGNRNDPSSSRYNNNPQDNNQPGPRNNSQYVSKPKN